MKNFAVLHFDLDQGAKFTFRDQFGIYFFSQTFNTGISDFCICKLFQANITFSQGQGCQKPEAEFSFNPGCRFFDAGRGKGDRPGLNVNLVYVFNNWTFLCSDLLQETYG